MKRTAWLGAASVGLLLGSIYLFYRLEDPLILVLSVVLLLLIWGLVGLARYVKHLAGPKQDDSEPHEP